MKPVQTYEDFLNEARKYKLTDFPAGCVIHYKNGEDWIVLANLHGKIKVEPHNDLAKKKNGTFGQWDQIDINHLNAEAEEITNIAIK